MKRIESEVEIPSEVFERGAAQLVERFGEEELLVLAAGDALGLWPEPAIVERDLTQAMKDYPLQFLFPHTAISTDGRSQPEPDDPGRRQEAQLVRFFASETAARVATSRIVVKVLADQGRWSSVKVVNAISLASSELAAACRPALEELDAGSSWAAAHTLVPQMERALRMLASQSGASVLRASRRGGFEWASLDEMLADDRLDQALGDRLAVAIKRLFSDPNGPNYRNDIAHGAVDPERDLSGATWLAMMAILAICLRSLSTASRAGHATESG
jgi:hypothetical protein